MKSSITYLSKRLLTGWNFLRAVRLGLSVALIVEAWRSSELIFALMGGFLAFQAAFNYGCCGMGVCDVDNSNSGAGSLNGQSDATAFEEVR